MTTTTERTCTRCGYYAAGEDAVQRDFGFRTDRGRRYVQPQCRTCRRHKRHDNVWDIAPSLTFGVEIEWTHGASRMDAARGAQNALDAAGFQTSYRSSTSFAVLTSRGWQDFNVVYDGSVGGGEMVTPPLTLADMDILQTVVRGMKAGGCRTRQSQAGIHVHVGAQDLTVAQIRNVARFTHAWEDNIKAVVNTDADRTRWCGDMKRAFVDALESKSNGWTSEDLDEAWYSHTGYGHAGKTRKYHNSRYHGLNLHALFTNGTMEFRYFNGTLHAGKIRAYVELCLALVARAKVAKQATSKRREWTRADEWMMDAQTIETRLESELDRFFRFLEMTGRERKTARFHLTNNARMGRGLHINGWRGAGLTEGGA
jgi:hypothetical protein